MCLDGALNTVAPSLAAGMAAGVDPDAPKWSTDRDYDRQALDEIFRAFAMPALEDLEAFADGKAHVGRWGHRWDETYAKHIHSKAPWLLSCKNPPYSRPCFSGKGDASVTTLPFVSPRKLSDAVHVAADLVTTCLESSGASAESFGLTPEYEELVAKAHANSADPGLGIKGYAFEGMRGRQCSSPEDAQRALQEPDDRARLAEAHLPCCLVGDWPGSLPGDKPVLSGVRARLCRAVARLVDLQGSQMDSQALHALSRCLTRVTNGSGAEALLYAIKHAIFHNGSVFGEYLCAVLEHHCAGRALSLAHSGGSALLFPAISPPLRPPHRTAPRLTPSPAGERMTAPLLAHAVEGLERGKFLGSPLRDTLHDDDDGPSAGLSLVSRPRYPRLLLLQHVESKASLCFSCMFCCSLYRL